MIINRVDKVAFVEVPKTGSTTIRQMFLYRAPDREYDRVLIHARTQDYARALIPDNIEDYTFYGFYRDPVERFMSGWRYAIMQYVHMETLEVAPSYERAMTRFYGPNYRKEGASAENISAEMFIDAMIESPTFPVADLLTPQTDWLDDRVILLDYRKYDEEVARLLPLLGLDYSGKLGRDNSTGSEKYLKTLTPKTVRKIKSHYKSEYEFFARKGITFSEANYVLA